jgi:hypothetical protein
MKIRDLPRRVGIKGWTREVGRSNEAYMVQRYVREFQSASPPGVGVQVQGCKSRS